MSYALPTADDFKAYFVRDFPYAVPAVGGAGTAVVVANAVTAINLAAPGSGYTESPTVIITPANGGPGSGAAATAQVAAGKVTGFTVTAPGSGYVGAPVVTLVGGAGDDTNLEKVTSTDINKALFEAAANFNVDLFSSQQQFSMAFLYLTAHYLVQDIAGSQQGLASKYSGVTTQRSVGNVSESYELPDKIKKDPALSYYSTTSYGMKYLSIIGPLLIGNMMATFRQSLP